MPRATSIWEFQRKLPKMSPNVRAFRNVLQSAGFTDEERLVRESLQNSVDAHRADATAPVRVKIEKKSLTGTAKRRLVDALGLAGEPHRRHDQFNLPAGNAFTTLGSRSPLPVIAISDYNTKGLSGVWNGTAVDDHFGRLVVHFGNDDKADGSDSTGGSFGFGKTVYAKASRIGIVLYYSVFPPSTATDGAHCRLMATGLFDRHSVGSIEYTGFAFFGAPDARARDEVVPFVNAAAHEIAKECGIEARGADEFGTTILILDCDLDVQAMRSATEKYWWPRIIGEGLDVAFVADGVEAFPQPKTNASLKPFVECMHNLTGEIQRPPKSRLKQFNRVRINGQQYEVGTLSCSHLPEENSLANHVALIRKPGMVVNYRAFGSEAYEPCVGVYRAADAIDKVLTYSEPPSHDRWDSNADRLRFHYHADGAAAVLSIESRIATSFKDFQREQIPPPPPGGLSPKELSTLLGKVFGGRGPIPPPPPPGAERPVSIHLTESRIVRGDETFDKAAIEVRLPDDSDLKQVRCKVSAHHEVLGDASHRLIGRTMVRLCDTRNRVIAKGRPASHVFVIKRGESIRVNALSKTDPAYLTRVRVTVEEDRTDGR